MIYANYFLVKLEKLIEFSKQENSNLDENLKKVMELTKEISGEDYFCPKK